MGEGGEDGPRCCCVIIYLKFDLNITAVCRVYRLAFVE